MKISLIIRTFNEEAEIEYCLNALINQSILPKEILIVDNMSTDRTLDKVNKYKNKLPIIVINNPVRGYVTGLNMGFEKSKGDLIVYLSADCRPESSWLEELIKCYEFTDAAAVQGHEILDNTNNIHYVLNKFAIKTDGSSEVSYVNNTNTLFVKSRLAPFMPFEGKHGGEDSLMSIKLKQAGFKLYKNHKSVVHHNKFSNITEFRNRMREQGMLCREMFFKMTAYPRLYLNPIYWSCKELAYGILKFDIRFINVGVNRILYTLLGVASIKKKKL